MDVQTIDISGLLRQRSLFDEEPRQAVSVAAPAGVRTIARTPEVDQLLAADCVVALSVSGGKDGSAMALAVVKHLDRIGHRGPRLLMHADLGRIEWEDSLPSCQRLAKLLGLELMVVRRKAGDLMARWEGRWANNVARYETLACVKLILPFSTAQFRFCTSEMKTSQLVSALKKRYPTQNILNVVGIRREESARRRKMPVSVEMPGLAKRGYTGLTWNPVIEWPVQDVWAEINGSGLVPHEGYTKYNVSRVSCVYCIMGSLSDLKAAATCEANQEVYRSLVSLEAQSTFGFQSGRWLADVAPHLLGTELTQRVAHGKAMSVERQAAEAELKEHMLFVKGVPTGVPTSEDAEVIASVRRRVNKAVGLTCEYLDGESVVNRYKGLLGQSTGLIEEQDEEDELEFEAA